MKSYVHDEMAHYYKVKGSTKLIYKGNAIPKWEFSKLFIKE
jgi:hypothetical protein